MTYKFINKMSETTKILMPEGGGCDAATMAMLGNNQWSNNPFWAIVLLSMIRGNGGLFNNGGCVDGNAQLRSIQDTLNSQQTNNLVMDAIKGNAGAIDSLATKMGCSADQITSAINCVNNMVTQMGYQNQLSNCQQTNNIERGFAQTNYNLAEQSCQTRQSAKDNTLAIIAKLDQIEDSRKDREISALTAQLASVTARAERANELAPIYAALKDIQCKQPSVVTLPYSCATAVPTSLAYQAGLYGSPYTQWG